MILRVSFVAAAWILLSPVAVFGHASLNTSTPPAGGLLEVAPQHLVLRFTEAVELIFSRVVIYDAQGQEQARPTLSYFQPPLELEVPLQSLPKGTYTVAWKVTSAVDGHVTKGAFSFSIGTVTDPNAPAAGEEDAGSFPIGRLAARWLGFAGLFGMLGVAAFLLLAVDRRQDGSIGTHLLPLARWCALLAFFSEGIDLVYQAALAVEAPFWQGFSTAHWLPLLSVRYGQLGVLRMAFALLGCLLSWGRTFPIRKVLTLAAAGVGLAVARSLSGHSAALGQNTLWISDALHLVALGAWLGGLISILWLWPKLNPTLDEHLQGWARWLPRFSNLALACALTVAVTGFYSAWAHVPHWDAYWTTDYGRSLLAKSALFLTLALLAAPNLLKHVPAIRRAAGTTAAERATGQLAARRLARMVALEALFAAVILMLGSLLTLLPPASVAAVRSSRPSFVETQTADYDSRAIALSLSVTPAQVGPGQVRLKLTEMAEIPLQAQRVRLRLTYLNQNLGSAWVTLNQQPDGAYGLDGSLFSLPGIWRVQVQARFAGKAKDLESSFEVNIADAQGNPGPIPQGLSTEQQTAIERGKEIYRLHCAACHGETGKGDGPAAASLPTPPADLSAHLIHQERDSLAQVIQDGFSTGMPAFGALLRNGEMNDLIEYLRTLEESGSDY